MPYIGKQLVRGQNRKLDDISSGFNGSQTTFTLQIASQNVSVGSALQLWISVGGVIQNPLTDFTIAGNQITFTTAPAASLDFFGVIQGDVTDTNTPGDATVTTSKLATGLTVNLADGSAATSSLQLGGTDSGLFSSAADKVNVTTGGVERLEIGSSEVVFNDPSNDVDFRVESNGQTHMLFVDGGNDNILVGTSSAASNSIITVRSASPHLSLYGTPGSNTSQLNLGDTDDHDIGNISYAHSDNSMRFTTNAAERLRIDSSGNLNFAQEASSNYPEQKLKWSNDSTTANGFYISQDSSRNGRIFHEQGLDILFGTNNAERLRIDSSGNVGINNSSPGSYNSDGRNLVVGSGSGGQGLSIASGTSNYGTIYFADGTSGDALYRGAVLYNHASDFMRFDTAAGERLRIDSSGRLLVGTTTSNAAPLTVAGTVGFGDSRFRAVFGDGYLDADSTGTFGAGNSEVQIQTHQNNRPALLSLGGPQGTNEGLGGINFFNSGNTDGKRSRALIYAAQQGSNSDQGGMLLLYTAADGGSSPTERMKIQKDGSFNVYGVYSATGAASANVVVDSGGQLFRSTSSAKYKIDIETIDESYSDALLNCRPVWYRSICSTDNSAHSFWGFIAEEVAEIDPRLVHWKTTEITYDEKSSAVETPCDPEPEGVAYDRFVPHLLNLIKRQKEQIEAMEARLSALEAG